MDKVDRALEMQVIDWLQWTEFGESIVKNPDESDMAQLTLTLISKRKQYCKDLIEQNKKLVEALAGLEDVCDGNIGCWCDEKIRGEIVETCPRCYAEQALTTNKEFMKRFEHES